MADFLYAAKTWLPRMSRIFFLQYGWIVTTPHYGYWAERTGANWSDDEYYKAAHYALSKYIDGWTPTYTAINKMLWWWGLRPDANPQPRTALMIIITDGEPTQDNFLYDRQNIIDRVGFFKIIESS